MSSGYDDIQEEQRKFEERLRHYESASYHYEIAAAVIYFLVLLGGIAFCAVMFTRLNSSGSRVTAWLKTSSIVFVLYCAVQVCSISLQAWLDRLGSMAGDDDSPIGHGFESKRAASWYMYTIGPWLDYMTQAVIFVAIVASCASMSGGSQVSRAPKISLIIAYAAAAAAIAIASAQFGIRLRRDAIAFDREVSRVYYGNLTIVSFRLELAVICIMAALALIAASFSALTLYQNMQIGGKDKPAKLFLFSGALLMISTLYHLGWTVRYVWHPVLEFGRPSYLPLMDAFLNALPLLGAIALLFLGLKSWNEGAASN